MSRTLAALVFALLVLSSTPAFAGDANGAASCEDALAAARTRIAELEAAKAGAAPAVKSAEGYGKTRWGMSEAEVRKRVPGLTETDNGLAVRGDVGGRDAWTVYFFNDDRLTVVAVVFTDTYINANKYLNDFGEIDGLLRKKYGTPTEDAPRWSQSLYKDDPEQWGTAVSVGHLEFVTFWDTEHTNIQHILEGGNFKVTHRIRYASRALAEAQKQASENEKLEDL